MKKTKVLIGRKEYEIKQVNRISGNNNPKHTFGTCNPIKKEIKIVKHNNKEDTFFHELTHAIFNELHDENPRLERKLRQLYNDELFIQRLSEILRGMFTLK